MNESVRKPLLLLGAAASFVAVADGIAMMLPGPASALGGATFVGLGLVWLLVVLPRFMSVAGRRFSHLLVARLGLVLAPVLCLPVAGLWRIATPEALNVGFGVAWASVWLACVVATALLPCPACGAVFGRAGWRLSLGSSTCVRCGADARAGESPGRAEPKGAHRG